MLNTKTRLFADTEERLSEADQLLVEDKDPAINRAIVFSFYNGQETRSEQDAAKDDVAGIVNYLTGFDSLNQATSQIFSIYTAAPNLWEFEALAGPELKRKEWGHRLTKGANCAVKRARTFKEEWRAAAGEMTLHGRAVLCYLNRWDLFPRCTQLYVPRGTGIHAEDMTYAVMPQRISLADLRRYEKRAEGDHRWNGEAVKGAIEYIEGQIGAGATTSTTGGLGANRISPEEQALEDQEGGCGEWRTHLPVYFFYEVDSSDPMLPVTLTIVARYDANLKGSANKDSQVRQRTLFHEKKHFAHVRHWIHPFFVDCAIGQTTTWHRTMGLGRLNYEPDLQVEEFFNEAMVGAKENVRSRYKVQDGADRETIIRQMMESANIMPEGVDFAEFSKNPNFQYAFQIIDRLQLLSAKNAGGQNSNQQGGNSEELEIQALERQNRNAKALGNRMNDIYESLDVLGCEVLRRLCYSVMRPTDRDYYHVQEFRDGMQREGVPYKDLARVNRGSYRFLKVRTSQAAGDGNEVQRRMNLRAMMAFLHLYDPEAQRKILRDFTALNTGNYNTAEELVPIQEKPDGSQLNRANNENDTCRLRGITGHVPPINSDDLHLIHLPEHAGGMEALLALGQLRGWQQEDLAAFMSIGSHAMAHVQQVQAIPEQKDIGNEWAQKLESIARAGQEFAKNLQEQSQQQQISPVDQARIEDMQHKRAMAERQQLALESHRDRETTLKEQKTASAELTEFERLNQGEEQIDNQRLQMVLSAKERATNRAASRKD